jgi:hypothetical protein
MLREPMIPGTSIEFEFTAELAKAVDKSEALAIEGRLSSTEKPDQAAITAIVEDPYLTLAELSPAAAIIEAFKDVEVSILENKNELPGVKGDNLLQFVYTLDKLKLIDSRLVEQFVRVRKLRNIAVHTSERFTIPPGEVLQYRELCRALATAFRNAFAKLRHGGEPR